MLHSSLRKESPAEVILLAFLWVKTASGQRGATQRMDCTADLVFSFVWDETASGTLRSNTENGLNWLAELAEQLICSSVCMKQDCLWDSEEPYRGYDSELICPSFIMGQDCFWDKGEQNVGDTNPFVPGDLDKGWSRFFLPPFIAKLNKVLRMAQCFIHCATCLYVYPLG